MAHLENTGAGIALLGDLGIMSRITGTPYPVCQDDSGPASLRAWG
ncbi:MAG: hypothetical protein AAGH83_07860 [Pseudomonadota bacterium]